VLGQPDIYEQPFPQLDFVYKRRFANQWRFTLKLRNLLDPEVEFTQGQETTRVYKLGRAVSLERPPEQQRQGGDAASCEPATGGGGRAGSPRLFRQ
jgi:hypothetical protein